MGINVPSLQLNNGEKMPQVGFGLWKVENSNCADIVYNAIKTGYRLFDGAAGTFRVSYYPTTLAEHVARSSGFGSGSELSAPSPDPCYIFLAS